MTPAEEIRGEHVVPRPVEAPDPGQDPERRGVLASMAEALEDEIAAVKSRGETRLLPFASGSHVRTVAGAHQYLIHLAQAPGRVDAVTVALTARGMVVNAELLEVDGRDLLVASARDLGDVLGRGTVEIDPSAILEMTLLRLGEVDAGSRDIDWTALDELLGLAAAGQPAPEEEHSAEPAPADADEYLDAYQEAAVAACRRRTVAFVWGPPGTGKTRTLGRLAATLVAAGKKVLLVAHAHVAVDAALVAALSAGCGAARRVGMPQLAEVPRNVVVDHLDDDLSGGCLVAATLSRVVVGEDFGDSRFDHVLVDEASMAQLPQVVIAAETAPQLSVFGDMRQLPPVVTAGSSTVARWLARDVFETAGVAATIGTPDPDTRLTLLRRQYRSHPRIAAVTNDFAYGGRLESAAGTAAHDSMTAAPPAAGEAVVLVDTSSLASVAVRPRRSRCNPLAALVTVSVATAALDAAPVLSAGQRLVGIATPYVEQLRLLRALLEDFGREDDVELQTVHRFQGGEREMMIVDLCDAQPLRPPPFLQDDEGLRLVNVALSRARSKLAVVADRRWLAAGVTGRAVGLVAREGKVCDAADLLASTHGISWLGMESFLEQASVDVARASERVLVRAPRLQATSLADSLVSAARGCEHVEVVTDERADPAVITSLAKAGAEVEVTRVADRLIVADGTVYTANTVSRAARQGRSMLRIQAPQFARRLAAALAPG